MKKFSLTSWIIILAIGFAGLFMILWIIFSNFDPYLARIFQFAYLALLILAAVLSVLQRKKSC